MGLALFVGLGAPIALSLGLHFLTNAIPKLARIAVAGAASRLPVLMQSDQEAAWLADLASLETHFEMLSCAFACWVTSLRVRAPFAAEKSHRDLINARIQLRAHGAIVCFALNRLKAWDTSANPREWSTCERYLWATILVIRAPIEECMRNYLLCLENDLKQRPRQYESQEEAAKELFVPIHREIKIVQFLRDHELGIDIQHLSRSEKTRGIGRGAK